MQLIQHLLTLNESIELKAPSFGEMQRKIYAAAISYFLKAQSEEFQKLSNEINYEAKNDRFWTSAFDQAHTTIENFVEDGDGNFDYLVDDIGEAFDSVVNKIVDYYSDKWNFAPGVKLPAVEDVDPIEGDDLYNLIYDLVPGVKAKHDAEEEHAGIVSAMHKDIMKIANRQKMTKLGRETIAPWVNAIKAAVESITSQKAEVTYISFGYTSDRYSNVVISATRFDKDDKNLIPGAKLISANDVRKTDAVDSVEMKLFNSNKTADYTVHFKQEVPANVTDLVSDEFKKLYEDSSIAGKSLSEAKSSLESDSIVKHAAKITLLDDSVTRPEIKLDKSTHSHPFSSSYLIYVGTSLYILLEYSKGGSTLGTTSLFNLAKLNDGKVEMLLKRNVRTIEEALVDVGYKRAQTKLKAIPKSVLAKFKSKAVTEDNQLKLTAKDGRLYLNNEILVCVYDSGDADSLPWPIPKNDGYWNLDKWQKALTRALYDEREMGNIPSKTTAVILPNGKSFTF